jgi:hypothetical protein
MLYPLSSLTSLTLRPAVIHGPQPHEYIFHPQNLFRTLLNLVNSPLSPLLAPRDHQMKEGAVGEA